MSSYETSISSFSHGDSGPSVEIITVNTPLIYISHTIRKAMNVATCLKKGGSVLKLGTGEHQISLGVYEHYVAAETVYPEGYVSSRIDYNSTGGPSYPFTFNDTKTVFIANAPGSYYGFVSPKHLAFYTAVIPVKDQGVQNPDKYGKFVGIANLPPGYFSWHGTVWYTNGKGQYLGMTSPARYSEHQATHPGSAHWGELDIDPAKFMQQLAPF